MNNPRVAVLGARCPVHGPVVIRQARQGSVELGCGCSWVQRGDDEWEAFCSDRGWDTLIADAQAAGFDDSGYAAEEVSRA